MAMQNEGSRSGTFNPVFLHILHLIKTDNYVLTKTSGKKINSISASENCIYGSSNDNKISREREAVEKEGESNCLNFICCSDSGGCLIAGPKKGFWEFWLSVSVEPGLPQICKMRSRERSGIQYPQVMLSLRAHADRIR